MPLYPEELIEEVRLANDITDVISGYVRLQKKGSTYFGLCPFHNEKTPSFSVTPAKQMYYCFGCGVGGNVFTFLKDYENYTFQEAVEYLAKRAGIRLPEREMGPQARLEADIRVRILEINKVAAKYFYAQLKMEQGRQAKEYLEGRKLLPEMIRKFGLGYSNKYSDDLYRYLRQQGYKDEILRESGLITIDEKRGGYDKFWNRIMFPIMDTNHRVIGFGGRVMGTGEPKYINSPETKIFDKSRNLYGLNLARVSRKPQILLCEGYMDVIALHQAGFDNAVAALGTAFTMGHANLLKRYAKEIYLTFDSDGAGTKAALRAIPILKEAGLTARIIDMKPYKDPDEFIGARGNESFQERIDNAGNSFMFELSVLESNYNLEDPESKTAFYNEAAKKILEFEEAIERDIYIEAVASRYQVGYENLRKLVNHIGARRERTGQKNAWQETAWEKKTLKRKQDTIKKEDGMFRSQKLLLTWLIEDTRLFEIIEPYIGAEDFTEPVYFETAKILFEQYRQGQVNPAKIVSMFTEEEQQGEIASLFHAKISEIETKQDKEKALKETIARIKQNSIDYRSGNLEPADLAGMQKLMEDKRKLQEIQKLYISID